jgi:hypothetical protein
VGDSLWETVDVRRVLVESQIASTSTGSRPRIGHAAGPVVEAAAAASIEPAVQTGASISTSAAAFTAQNLLDGIVGPGPSAPPWWQHPSSGDSAHRLRGQAGSQPAL